MKGECFIIRCAVKVRNPSMEIRPSVLPPNEIHQDLVLLLESAKGAPLGPNYPLGPNMFGPNYT